jgi:ABC-type phosphate transport system substrate-binding protein
VFGANADPKGPWGAVDCVGDAVPTDNVQFLYASIGSGGGVTAFINYDTPSAVPAVTEPPYTSSFFPGYPYPDGPGTAGTVPAIGHHFSLTEATLSTTQLTTYNTNNLAARGPAIQAPLLATNVALSIVASTFNNLQRPIPVTGTSNLYLNREQYCAIWGGYVTDFADGIFKASNKNKSITTLASLPITRVVRQDSSGTTFIFTQRLADQCEDTIYPFWDGGARYIPGTRVSSTTVPSPANSTVWNEHGNPVFIPAAAGNGAVAQAVQLGNGNIGYNSPAFIEPFVSNGVVSANLQTFLDPQLFIAPTVASTLAAIGNVLAPTGAAFTDPLAWGALQAIGTDGVTETIERPNRPSAYPIVGFNYGLFYPCYISNNVRNGITTVLTQLFLSTQPEVEGLHARNGFARITGNLRTGVRNLTLNDNRTRIRTGPVAANVDFPGCSGGA